MHVGKKLLSAVMAVVLMVGLCPASALASEAGGSGNMCAAGFASLGASAIASGESGSCSWSIDAKGKLTVKPKSGKVGTLGDFEVTEWDDDEGDEPGYYTYYLPPWSDYAKKIKSVAFQGKVKAQTCRNMFAGCANLTSVDLTGLDTSRVTVMRSMFASCSALKVLDLSALDTSLAKDMSDMFFGCSSLKSLDLTRFETSNVNTMATMFYKCTALTSLDLSSFDTSAMKGCEHMFDQCAKLKTIYVSKLWTTEAIMEWRFDDDPVYSYYTSGLYAFRGCVSLKGGAGTTYDEEKTDAKFYGHIDSKSNPGYFTAKGVPLTSAELKVSKSKYTYTGSPCKPKVTVKRGSATLKQGTDYEVEYKNNVNAGKATVTVKGKGDYSGSKSASFTIAKAANPMSVAGKTASVKYSKKKSRTVKASAAYKFKKKAAGKVTYSRVASGSSKWLPKVNSKTGAITVKAGAPKGKTQSVKVKLAAKGDANRKSATKTVTVKVKVK